MVLSFGGLLLPGTAQGRLRLPLGTRNPPGTRVPPGNAQPPPAAANAAPLRAVLGLISTSPTPVTSGVRPQLADPCAFNPAASPQHLSGTRTAPWPGGYPGRASTRPWWEHFSTRSRCLASCSRPVPLWPPCARALFCSELTSGPPGLPSARGLERRGWGHEGHALLLPAEPHGCLANICPVFSSSGGCRVFLGGRKRPEGCGDEITELAYLCPERVMSTWAAAHVRCPKQPAAMIWGPDVVSEPRLCVVSAPRLLHGGDKAGRELCEPRFLPFSEQRQPAAGRGRRCAGRQDPRPAPSS